MLLRLAEQGAKLEIKFAVVPAFLKLDSRQLFEGLEYLLVRANGVGYGLLRGNLARYVVVVHVFRLIATLVLRIHRQEIVFVVGEEIQIWLQGVPLCRVLWIVVPQYLSGGLVNYA